jgi:hypothetical protein
MASSPREPGPAVTPGHAVTASRIRTSAVIVVVMPPSYKLK